MEQEVVNQLLVLQGQGGNFTRYREDDVHVGCRQKLPFTRLEPVLARVALALGTVAVTTIGCTAYRGILSWSWGDSFCHSSGMGLAGWLHLVCDCPRLANHSSVFSGSFQRCPTWHAAFALDDSAIVLWPGGLYFVILGSLFAEEPGWRGFGQPRLQTRYGALAASILIGLLWSTWHLWYVIAPGGFANVTETAAVATYVRLTSTSIVYAWMYNNTNGSLLIAMLAHLGHNLAASFMPTPDDGGRQHLIVALIYLVMAMVVIVWTEPRTLRRPMAV